MLSTSSFIPQLFFCLLFTNGIFLCFPRLAGFYVSTGTAVYFHLPNLQATVSFFPYIQKERKALLCTFRLDLFIALAIRWKKVRCALPQHPNAVKKLASTVFRCEALADRAVSEKCKKFPAALLVKRLRFAATLPPIFRPAEGRFPQYVFQPL